MAEIELSLPQETSLDAARPDRAFRVVGDTAFLWFEPRDDRLLIAFDNLATLDHPYPRLPWLHRSANDLGMSILGVQSHAKDWFRQATAPGFLRRLTEQRFFDGFTSITMAGASMGGFAAINFAPLIPRARVLALSPQSSMSREVAPFEARFPWAVRNSDWTTPAFLDAAQAVPFIPALSIIYDPFVPEDKAHAARLSGPNVQHVALRHGTHEAVRVVVKSGALDPMLAEFAELGRVGPDYFRHLRQRRSVRKWARAFTDNLMAANHPKLVLPAMAALLKQEDYLFASRARDAILAKHPELAEKD